MKSIVLCINNFDNFKTDFDHEIVRLAMAQVEEIHLLHVFKPTYYNDEFARFSWPVEKDYPKIQKTIKAKLASCADDLKVEPSAKITTSCVISNNVNEEVKDYIKNNQIDLCILATQKSNHFIDIFHSSLTDYLTKHATSDIVSLRH